MTGFPNSPKLARGGLIVMDPVTGVVRRIIALQYNADTVTRTLQVRGVGAETGDRLEALRLKGPPTETIKLEAELDATDQLEFPDARQNAAAVTSGLHPALAALEGPHLPLVRGARRPRPPRSPGLDRDRAARGCPDTAGLGSKPDRAVRITEFSVTEEAFDSSLNPTRAKVSLGLRVLSVDDVGFAHRGGALYLLYQQQKETFVREASGARLGTLGLTTVPGA